MLSQSNLQRPFTCLEMSAILIEAGSSFVSASLRYFAIIAGLLRYLAVSKAGTLEIGQTHSQLFPLCNAGEIAVDTDQLFGGELATPSGSTKSP
jgi:hypothetical protein